MYSGWHGNCCLLVWDRSMHFDVPMRSYYYMEEEKGRRGEGGASGLVVTEGVGWRGRPHALTCQL